MGAYGLPKIQSPEDPVEQDTRIANLKTLLGQQKMQPGQLQLQQQAIQSGQMQNQQQQLDLDSQKAIMRGYTEANGDVTKAEGLAAKYGAKPSDLIKLRQAGIDQQKQAIELVNAKGARAMQEADLVNGMHETVNAAPAEQKAQVYQQQLQGLAKAGVDVSQLPPQYPGDQGFQVIGAAVKGHKQLVEDAFKQAETDKNKAQGNEAQAKADQLSRQTVATQLASAPDKQTYAQMIGKMPFDIARQFPPPEAWSPQVKDLILRMGMTPDQQVTTSQGAQRIAGEAAGRAETARHNKASEANQNIFGSIPTDDGTTGQDLLRKLAPPQQAFIKGMLDYTIDPKTLSNRGPSRYQAIAIAKQIDPNFDESQYQTRYNLKKSFTSGPYSQQLNAINTAREHMQTFTQLADALNNKDTQVLNTVGNALSVQFGNDQVTNFNIAKNAFSGEVGKAFAGANVTQGDRQEVEHQIQAAQSPAQLKGAAATADKLLEGKQIALKKTYDDGMKGSPNFGNTGGISVTDPNGGVHTFKTQAEADNFKKAISK